MRTSKIKAKLSRDEPALCTQLHLTDPSVFELTSLLGFDGIWMDLEHHGYSVETAGQLMRAARRHRRHRGPASQRGVHAHGSPARNGSPGDHVPALRQCPGSSRSRPLGKVRAARHPRLRRRQRRRPVHGGSPDRVPRARQSRTLIIIQLEHQDAVDRAEEIAATPGVDLLMLGPADFSILSGFPLQFDHPKIIQAMEKIAAAAAQHRQALARTAGTLEQVQQSLELGARLFFHNADIVMVKNGLEQMQTRFAPLGFTFENRIAAVEATEKIT